MHVLLTGATGLVGQYLLRDLLLEGTPVAVLIRSQGKKTAHQRLDKIFAHWDRELCKHLPRPRTLEGDISQEGLGLGSEDRSWASKHCHSVLHNAASLTFFGKDRNQEPWRSTYTGTQHILEFCRTTGVRELHYMSTAYVCGKRTDTVREDELDRGQEFRNDYEQCKFEAEKLVRAASFLDRLTVFRPAAITGDAHTGYTSTYHGFYSYLQFIWLMVQLLPRDENGRIHYPVRLTRTGDEELNLVPVDWVSAVTSHILLHPELHGRTYHLAPLKRMATHEAHQGLADYFNFYGPTYVGPGELDSASMNPYEMKFYDYVSRYEQYWTDEPTFDCTNTRAAAPHLPCPHMDADMVRRLIDFAVQDRFGKRREARKERPVTV